MDFEQECASILKILTKQEHVFFTRRCNESIQIALQYAADQGRSHLLKQEEGGWLTYQKYAVQSGLEITNMITLNGAIAPKELDHYGMDEVLILNSLAGYVTPLDMFDIAGRCIQNDIFLINDVSASIGLSIATQGDIVVGSFGPAKPVNLGTGGFVATNSKDAYDALLLLREFPPEIDFEDLLEKLKGLSARRKFLEEKASQIKKDLAGKDLVSPDATGSLNVIVRFETEEQKQELITYCEKNNLEYTECPREIRVLDDAISIEVKRLTS